MSGIRVGRDDVLAVGVARIANRRVGLCELEVGLGETVVHPDRIAELDDGFLVLLFGGELLAALEVLLLLRLGIGAACQRQREQRRNECGNTTCQHHINLGPRG